MLQDPLPPLHLTILDIITAKFFWRETLQFLKLVFINFLQSNVISTLLVNKSWRLREGWNVGLLSLLSHSEQLGWQSCQLHTRPALYPKEISRCSFLLGAEWTPGQLYLLPLRHTYTPQHPSMNRLKLKVGMKTDQNIRVSIWHRSSVFYNRIICSLPFHSRITNWVRLPTDWQF